MRLLFTITTFFICVGSLYSQGDGVSHLNAFKNELTPSPVLASLGIYGGMDVAKSSGGISKHIPLFDVGQRGFRYQPSISYFSTGIKVDDWGGRLGIGWTENITAVITRTVMSVPDELATSRINGAEEFGSPGVPEYTQASYDKIYSLSRQDTRVDGEYDLFNYNLFGLSGQFIIVDSNAVLLSKEQNVKVTINATSPTYKFTLTTPDGIIYSFNSQTETTKYNYENACEFDYPSSLGFITTAWFVDKINSNTGYLNILFSYDTIAYTHFYDFTQFYTQSFPTVPLAPGCDPDEFSLQPYSSSCFRKKDVKTKLLRTVQGTNFTIDYDYINREDLFNEKLLQKAILTSSTGQSRQVEFKYDTVIATSNFEGGLATHIPGGDETEAEGLKVRYFLNAVNVKDQDDILVHQYKLDYLFPFVLPHRFSFAQDMFGCYNGMDNENMVPVEAQPGLPVWVPIPYADRTTYPIGAAGLLKKIQYPTGGSDSIIYEVNSFAASGSPIAEIDTTFSPWYSYDFMSTGDDNSYNGSFFDIYAPFKMHAQVIIKYLAEEGADTSLEAEQFATVTLMNSDGPVLTDQFRIGDIKTYNNVLLETNRDYWLLVDIFGKHTVVWASLEATDRIFEGPLRDTNDYMGYRVKSVISDPVSGKKITKHYNYNTFNKTGTRGLTFSDSSSLTISPKNRYYSISTGKCLFIGPLPPQGGGDGYGLYPIVKLNKYSNYSPCVFNGMPFTYKKITEFTEANDTGFIAEEYNASYNGYASIIMGGETGFHTITAMSPAVDNSAWDQGLLNRRLIGGKRDGSYLIDQTETWNRSATSDFFYNYSASQLTDLTYVNLADTNELIAHHVLTGHQTYSHWIRLDSMETIVYSSANTNDTLITKTFFQYNSGDKMVEAEYSFGSDGKMLKRTIYRPIKMVSLGLDNTGVYASMKATNFISPEIISIKSVNNIQVSREQLGYTILDSSYFLPDTIKTQLKATDALETRAVYNKYDSYGNILEKQLAGNVKEVYLWGYGGQYPVARIIGMSYDALESAVDMDTALLNSLNTSNISAELTRIRTALASNSTVMIWTYTYLPMIGMTSQTDPSGKILYYEYDIFNRLSVIKDQDGRELKRFCYNYAGQPERCEAFFN